MGKIDCAALAKRTFDTLKDNPMIPETTLGIITVGNDQASESYVRGKIKDANKLGIPVIHAKPEATDGAVIDALINMSGQIKFGGIIIQLPLPPTVSLQCVLEYMPATLDVDCFKPVNYGLIGTPSAVYEPCTPAGVLRIINHELGYPEVLDGVEVCVIGRSRLVGLPLTQMLIAEGATVTCCNSSTPDLSVYTTNADIIVSATGHPGLIVPALLRPNHDQMLIDVGISRDGAGKLHGDVSEECYNKCWCYTSVPGGVGLMTRAMLMQNVLKYY